MWADVRNLSKVWVILAESKKPTNFITIYIVEEFKK